MSQSYAFDSMNVGNGTTMYFCADASKPGDSIGRRWTETTYDGTGKEFNVPLHWHKYHDEHLSVLEGKIELTVDGKSWMVYPSSGVQIAPRYSVHGMKFFSGVKTTLKEQTDPTGRFKEAFFRNLFSWGSPGFWHAMRTFYDHDTYPPLPGGIKLLDQTFVTIFGGFAKLFGPSQVILPEKKEA